MTDTEEIRTISNGMKLVQTCVAAGRRAKVEARTSFKAVKLLVHIRLDLQHMMLGGLFDWPFIVKGLLRAQDVYVEECGWSEPFCLTPLFETYSYCAGICQQEGIEVQLWTNESLWS